MNTFTVRLEDTLAKKLDKVCRDEGYNKNGIIKSLIQNFVAQKESKTELQKIKPWDLRSLVGLVSIGGDALEDTEALYDE